MKKNLISYCILSSIVWNGYAVDLNDFVPDSYPDVYQNATLLPYNPEGYYDHRAIFAQLITPQTKIAVEIGSWCGASTIVLANILPSDGKIYAVDTWLGSPEQQIGQPGYSPVLHYLFQQFISNVVHEKLEHKIIPIRMTSVEAAEKFALMNIRPDFIYIDGAHDYESVKQDLEAWYPLLAENGAFCGDDYPHPDVLKAVHEFAEKNDMVIMQNYIWWMTKK